MKPIQTHYRGYRTRSRLEARWMVYLDTVRLHFEYEAEGFDLGSSGYYLPDFWLPDVKAWAEVKPEPLSPVELQRCSALVLATGYDCVLLVGTPEVKAYERLILDEEDQHRHRSLEGLLTGVGLCDAKIDTEYVGERRFYGCTGDGEITDVDVLRAVAAARGARFEHGESGIRR